MPRSEIDKNNRWQLTCNVSANIVFRRLKCKYHYHNYKIAERLFIFAGGLWAMFVVFVIMYMLCVRKPNQVYL